MGEDGGCDGRAGDEHERGAPVSARPEVAVGLVARDRAGRLLLVRRANPPAKGAWSLPGVLHQGKLGG